MRNLNWWVQFSSSELRRRWFESQGYAIEGGEAVSKCRNIVFRFDGELAAIRCA